MRHRLYVHVVWTTLDRARSIGVGVAQFLTRYLPAGVKQERGTLLALGIVRTHVHVLAHVHPEARLPRMVQRLKGGSAALAGRERHGRAKLRWAKGYNIESVSPRALSQARSYVAAQADHHPEDAIEGWEASELAIPRE